MKRRLFTFALAVLTVGLLGSCSKINERIDGLDKRVYDLENAKIASIENQIAAINSSIADLGTIRQDILDLQVAVGAKGEDISELKAADEALGQRIDELKAYVGDLSKYAEKNWVTATFATLEQLEATNTALGALEKKVNKLGETTDAKIEGLKTELTDAIDNAISGINDTISTLEDRVAALEAMIQSVSITPAYSDGSVEAVDGILTLKCIVSPAEALIGMESLKDSLLIYADSVKVKTKATTPAYMTIEVSEASVLDAAQGAITLKADISKYLPKGEDKALTVAVNIKNGISDFTTEFVPVTVTTKPIVTVTFDLNGITGTAPETQKVAEDSKVTKPADPTDMVHTFAGWYKTKDATTGALSDPWDFDNDTVTADMTLYAKWTRTLVSIYTNSDIPKVEDNTAPDNAWENGDGGKAFIGYSGKTTEILCFNKKLEPSGAKTMSCKTTEKFTKIGDDYVFSYGTKYGVITCHMTEGKFTSVTYDGTGTTYEELSGTYTAAAPLPAGALKGVFSVSADKKVHFSQGNLYYDGSQFNFEANQYDFRTYAGKNSCINGASSTTGTPSGHWGLFGWSTDASSNNWGIHTKTTTTDGFTSGNFNDWGKNMGDGNTWRTLSGDEWTYLFNARTASTVNGTANARYAKATVNSKAGVILLPDTYAHPEGVTLLISINTKDAAFTANTYDLTNWKKMESAGAVFLPAAGYRNGSNVYDVGVSGSYWSSTASGSSGAHRLYFKSDNVSPSANGNRYFGYGVRLVTDVK